MSANKQSFDGVFIGGIRFQSLTGQTNQLGPPSTKTPMQDDGRAASEWSNLT